jgi:hypothetical protein
MNPEFQRNLILEFSVARLIGMPIFLLIVFFLSYRMNESVLDEKTAFVAIFLYVFIVMLWGARQTMESIFDEIRHHTWDIQQTSAISPWSLTWGKLFGSTLFNWYGGILCLIVYFICMPETTSIFMIMGGLIGGGVLLQALGLLVGLFALRNKQALNSNVSYLFVLFAVMQCLGLIFSFENNRFSVTWYSYTTDSRVFALMSLFLAAGWCIVGCYRLLAQTLQIRTLPWIWLVFNGFVISYFHGILSGMLDKPIVNFPFKSSFNALALLVFGINLGLTYLIIFFDENNPMLLRRLLIYVKQHAWRRFLEEIPCWSINLLLAFPTSLYLSFLLVKSADIESWHFYPFTLFLLVVRDIALILFLHYAANPKRAVSLSLLSIIFLNTLIPVSFMSVGANFMGALLMPVYAENALFAMIIASGHVVLMGYLLMGRWQKTVNVWNIEHAK